MGRSFVAATDGDPVRHGLVCPGAERTQAGLRSCVVPELLLAPALAATFRPAQPKQRLNVLAAIRAKLEPIVKLRQEVGKIDTEIEGKTRTRGELDQRAQETRANLEAIKRDPAAGALRKRLGDRLDQFAKDGDKLGRDLVELQTKRTEKKIALEDILQNLELMPKEPLAPKK